ncbi:hypothetical protein D3C71_1404080 [compost metagenome]
MSLGVKAARGGGIAGAHRSVCLLQQQPVAGARDEVLPFSAGSIGDRALRLLEVVQCLASISLAHQHKAQPTEEIGFSGVTPQCLTKADCSGFVVPSFQLLLGPQAGPPGGIADQLVLLGITLLRIVQLRPARIAADERPQQPHATLGRRLRRQV